MRLSLALRQKSSERILILWNIGRTLALRTITHPSEQRSQWVYSLRVGRRGTLIYGTGRWQVSNLGA